MAHGEAAGVTIAERTPEMERDVRIFYEAIANVFREPEDRVEIAETLHVHVGGDLLGILTAIQLASFRLAGRLAKETFCDMDVIDWSHMVNRMMIQHIFKDRIPDGDDEEEA